ncbi:uncharacterized protein LOC130667639 [Microplitis mediator]|uniref:uncharacterized protein LOC130667639 n=1 Tax=Microplitis mediator TaxID=375433 RepID=UPI00255410CF|nr:uncharacterized protein LOC130667639 [Microplitis mediator]
MWKISENCNSAKKVVQEWRSNNTHVGLEIMLVDMTLPENTVVTGVTFGKSLRGRYLNDDYELDDNVDEIVKDIQCPNNSNVTSPKNWGTWAKMYGAVSDILLGPKRDRDMRAALSRVPDLVKNCGSSLLPTSLIGTNTELSKSCENKIRFCASDEGTTGFFQHTVPYIDLQEIVTDQNAPEPLRGIGWYYRGHPGYGGYLALKIFK